MFPPTSFWGKPWWFRTPIPFSASSVLFQMLLSAYWTYKSMSSFGLTKQLTVFPFLISGLLWKIGDAGGIDPRTSRMQSERSTIWATSLVRKRAANDIWSLSFVNAMVEQFSIAYGCKIGFVDAVHQSMCFSHANRLPFRLTCLAGGGPHELFMSDGCLWFTHQYSNVSSDVFLRWTLVIQDSNPFLSKLCTVSDASFRILDVQIHVFFWSNKTAYRLSFFDFGAPLKNWRCGGHRSPYLSHAKRALYHLSYIPSEEAGS